MIKKRTHFFYKFWWPWSYLVDYDMTGEYGLLDFKSHQAAEDYVDRDKKEKEQMRKLKAFKPRVVSQ